MRLLQFWFKLSCLAGGLSELGLRCLFVALGLSFSLKSLRYLDPLFFYAPRSTIECA